MPAPNRKAKSLNHLPPGNENSSVITSEHDIYKKVPPASEVKTITTISEECYRANPSETPIGVAKANINRSHTTRDTLFLKALYKAILNDIASAYLCNIIAIIKSIATYGLS
jgi:hypothetical protein